MAVQTELPAWGTYFFICPYGPAELWNVKKYVFQAGTLTEGPPGGRTDSQPTGQAAAAGVRPPWQAAGASVAGPVPYRHCSVTLPVSAGGDVQTLNIQRADCGRGKWPCGRRGVRCGGRGGLGSGTEGACGSGASLPDTCRGVIGQEKGLFVRQGQKAAHRRGRQRVPKGSGSQAGQGKGGRKGLLQPRGAPQGKHTPWLLGGCPGKQAGTPSGLASWGQRQAPAGSEGLAAPDPPLLPLRHPRPKP